MQTISLVENNLDFRSKEAFKTLRSNIEFSGENIKVVAITSCTPNEGKSNVSYELARSIAESGKRVLLVDADLRKSVMKRRHRSGKVRLGMVHYLIGRNTLDDVTCETDYKNFYMAFAGPVPPNPSELLGSKRFDDLLAVARKLYDYVIIDTPPLGSVIDSAIIAKKCDGVAIVISSGSISYRFAQRVKEQLEKADCHILGCVLNKVDMSGKGYYGKYYGRYYGKYYGNYGQDEILKA